MYCRVYPYRDHTIILQEDPRILNGDNEVIAYLGEQDNDRAAALYIDGLLRGIEQGKSTGRVLARQEISNLASLLLGPVIQPIVAAIQDANK